MNEHHVNYYRDELSDEFSRARIQARRIDGHYRYPTDSIRTRLLHAFCYRIIAAPIAFLYTQCKFRHRIVGSECLRPYLHTGYFLYGNHTQDIGDAFLPNMLQKRQDKYVIVHPSNVSIPVIGRATPFMGALPLPDDHVAYRNFITTLEHRLRAGNAVVIYPEAHIWPYYTGLRPFGDASFCYPVRFDVPAFCFTNTYQRQNNRKTPQIVTYVDGPFFPDKCLSPRLCRRDLRDRIYACMTERAKRSDMVMIEYIKKED